MKNIAPTFIVACCASVVARAVQGSSSIAAFRESPPLDLAQYPTATTTLQVSYTNIDRDMQRLQVLEGFGVSLCWWAVGVGGWGNQTAFDEVMDLFFEKKNGLGLNQVRYNIGGGTQEDNSIKSYRAGGSVRTHASVQLYWHHRARLQDCCHYPARPSCNVNLFYNVWASSFFWVFFFNKKKGASVSTKRGKLGLDCNPSPTP